MEQMERENRETRKPRWDRRGPAYPFPTIDRVDRERYKFLFHTEEWLDDVKRSYRRCIDRRGRSDPLASKSMESEEDVELAIRKEARLQCGKDWHRMTVEDRRSYRKIAQDYLWGNRLLDFFGSQTCMARVFELLMACFPSFVVTQCGQCAFKLVIYNHTVALYKRFLTWDPKSLGRPRGIVDVKLYVGPCNTRLDCKVSPL